MHAHAWPACMSMGGNRTSRRRWFRRHWFESQLVGGNATCLQVLFHPLVHTHRLTSLLTATQTQSSSCNSTPPAGGKHTYLQVLSQQVNTQRLDSYFCATPNHSPCRRQGHIPSSVVPGGAAHPEDRPGGRVSQCSLRLWLGGLLCVSSLDALLCASAGCLGGGRGCLA